MPVAVSYPGVYIQEIPSGVHTIAGVSTSVTAFVGRAFRGPVNKPTTVNSYADYQRFFGGLNADSTISYSVRDFFQNGGGQGVVVRVYSQPVAYTTDYSYAAAESDAGTAAGTVLAAAKGTIGTDNTTVASVNAAVQAEATNVAVLTGPAGSVQLAVQTAAAQYVVSYVAAQLAAGVTALTTTFGAADLIAAVKAAAAAAAAPANTTASIVVGAPQSVFLAVNAALAVANAAWAAAVQPGATLASVQQAAAFASSGYRTLTTPERLAAAAVNTPVQNATGTPLAAAGEATTALTDASLQSAMPTGVTLAGVNALGTALAAGWAEVTPTATPAAVAAAIPADSAPALSAAALIAAGQAGATPQSVMQAASAAVAPAVAAAVAAASSTTPLTFSAANPGDWANGSLVVTVDQKGIPAGSLSTLLNVNVSYSDPTGGAMTESFPAVSVDPGAGTNRLDNVLTAQSNFITFAYAATPSIPAGGAWGVASGGTASVPLQEGDYIDNPGTKEGLYALELYDLFNILVIPPDTRATQDTPNDWLEGVYQTAAVYCRQRRAFLIIDPLFSWTSEWKLGNASSIAITDLGSYGPEGENAAVYFPHLIEGDPLMNGQPMTMPPSGAIAGIYARTDAARGVWKAPAGITDGAISGVMGLEIKMTDADNGFLNPQGINALRSFPTFGSVVWGARTLWGSDARSDDYKYVPVRRLVLYLEESLYRGTQWAVFEPNAEPLWASLRLAVGGFMNTLYGQGAFAGSSAKDAYFVACDATTTTQNDIDLGIVNVTVGFAPLKPAEFVVLTIQQIAAPAAT